MEQGFYVGPILMGAAKSAHIVSRHVTVRGLVNMSAVAVVDAQDHADGVMGQRSEEHTSELQSLMRISSAVFCLKKKIKANTAADTPHRTPTHMQHRHNNTTR